jgi:hypothetical protein
MVLEPSSAPAHQWELDVSAQGGLKVGAMKRHVVAFVIAALAVPLLAAAQEPPPAVAATESEAPSCAFHPAPECRYFGVTDFGLAFGSTHTPESIFDSTERRVELFIEGGVMRTFGARNAAGVTWFLAFDNDTGSTGPGLRYRRWVTRRQSVEGGVGVPLLSWDYEAGTLFGLIRYSPAPWIGLSVRPERIRRHTFDCVAGRCDSLPDSEVRVLLGGDLSGKPGAASMAAYGIAAGVLILVAVLAYSGGG